MYDQTGEWAFTTILMESFCSSSGLDVPYGNRKDHANQGDDERYSNDKLPFPSVHFRFGISGKANKPVFEKQNL